MGTKGGKREGAGRKPGIPNKKNADTIAAIEASGLTPLDYMLSIVRDGEADTSLRFQAASASAPYVHPKLSTIAHTGANGGPVRLDTHWTTELVRPAPR